MTEAASRAEIDLSYEHKLQKIDGELTESLLSIAEGYSNFALRGAALLLGLSVLVTAVFLGTADSLAELKLIAMLFLPVVLAVTVYFGYRLGVRSRLKVERGELNRFAELRSGRAASEAATPVATAVATEADLALSTLSFRDR